LCNKAQGWTEGTTLGNGDGRALNPNGVVAGGQRRRLVFQPPGRNPFGVDGHRRALTQGWRGANPGLCCTTPLGLERAGFIQVVSMPSFPRPSTLHPVLPAEAGVPDGLVPSTFASRHLAIATRPHPPETFELRPTITRRAPA
jgi:hypothetical protein